jgi:hypothetical protein
MVHVSGDWEKEKERGGITRVKYVSTFFSLKLSKPSTAI